MISDELRAERLASIDFNSAHVISPDLIDGQVVDEQVLASLSEFADPERANRMLVITDNNRLSIGGIAVKISPRSMPPINMLLAQGEAGFMANDLAVQETYRPGLGYEDKCKKASSDFSDTAAKLKRVARVLGIGGDRGLMLKSKKRYEVTNWLDVDLIVDERGEDPVCIVRTLPEIVKRPSPNASMNPLESPQVPKPEKETVLTVDLSDVNRVSTDNPLETRETMRTWLLTEKGGVPEFINTIVLIDTKSAMRSLSPEELKLEGVQRRFMQANRLILEESRHE